MLEIISKLYKNNYSKEVFPFVAGSNSVEHYLEAAAYDSQNHALSTPFGTDRYMGKKYKIVAFNNANLPCFIIVTTR